MWLAEELYYRGINNYIQAYMGDTLVWEKLNNDYFYVENTSSMYNSIGFTMRKVKAEYPLGDYDETSVTDLNFSPTLQYSLDGVNWNDYTAYLDGNYAEYPKIAVAGKKKIYFRGIGNSNWGKYSNYYWTFPKLTNTLGAKVGGDITTLLDYKTKLTSLPNRCFMRIFSNNANLYSAEKLHFGEVKQFREYTLARMFENCTYLSYPPKINEGYKPYGKGSFGAMFKNCTSLIDIPFNEITLANSYAYSDMFYHCTSLNKVPVISATSIGEGSFEGMYQGCTSLTTAPNFDTITSVGKFGCRTMFSGCKNLVNVPAILPAMTLSPFAYNYMFSGCSSMTKAPDLPALVVPDECYASMFMSCTALQSFPKMDFIETVSTVGEYDCCTNMFMYCRNATGRVVLNAKKIAGGSYVLMFLGCNKLTEMICYFEDTTDYIYAFDRWLQSTAEGTRGKLYVPSYSPFLNGGYNIPDNWDIINLDTIADYLKIDNAASVRYTTNGEITPNLEYSTDGVNFTKWDFRGLKASTIYLRGVNNQRISDMNNHLVIIDDDGSSSISGNIMSLVDGYGLTNEIPKEGMFEGLFLACDLGNITGLKLPATELKPYCYANMFDNATLNYDSFELPATKLAEGCYKEMFANSDVRNAYTDYDYNDNPHIEGILTELPATELAPYCYAGMFKNCRRLQCTPNLPATKLEEGCYKEMFRSCDNQYFIEINTLPATELAPYCYAGMYKNSSQERTYDIITDIIPTYACANMYEGCKLNYSPNITANKIEEYGCVEMFVRTSNLTVAKIPDITELAPYCYAGMYQQSSVMVSQGSVGRNLAPYCCDNMFAGSELIQISLLATKLEEGCYRDMFADCYNLNLIRCYAEELATYSTMGWVKGVCSEGKFYTKNLSIWEGLDNNDGIPYCWSVIIED